MRFPPPPPGSRLRPVAAEALVRPSHSSSGATEPDAPEPLKPVRAKQRSVSYDENQRAIIECNDREVVAEATAGSGKTTTAHGVTQARPNTHFLYVCFNNSVQVEASQRFGSNVTARTGHSLAFEAVGSKFKNQLTRSWSARLIMNDLNIREPAMAAVIMRGLNKFFTSVDDRLLPEHFDVTARQWGFNGQECQRALDLAEQLWRKMQVPGSGVSITDDTYMKIWALRRPKLSFDHIVLDEAQDSNAIMMQVIQNQTHAKKLLIGDRHQSIYQFRGAVNAMEQFAQSGATVLRLNRTWRFGPEIAGLANQLLSFFKDIDVGIDGAGPGKVGANMTKAVLSRTNAGLYAKAAEVMGRGVHWVGGIKNYRVDLLNDVYALSCDRIREVVNPGLRQFQSWAQYKEEMKATRDAEGRLLIKMVDEYGHDLPRLVEAFNKNAVAMPEAAQLCLSTAHKAKGLDFDKVVLAEDFSAVETALQERMNAPDEPLSEEAVQEINLLYVAMTRARHELTLNEATSQFFKNIDTHRQALHEAQAVRAATHHSQP